MIAEVMPGAKILRGLGTVASTVWLSEGVSMYGTLYGTVYGTMYGTVNGALYGTFNSRMLGRQAVFLWGRRSAVYRAVYSSRREAGLGGVHAVGSRVTVYGTAYGAAMHRNLMGCILLLLTMYKAVARATTVYGILTVCGAMASGLGSLRDGGVAGSRRGAEQRIFPVACCIRLATLNCRR